MVYIKIGNIELKYGLMLAPLAGVSDKAFRNVCGYFGAESTTSEMISAKGLHYNDMKTALLADFSAEEKPFFIQIFGSEPEIMAESALRLSTNDYPQCKNKCLPAGIDINMGCPMHKIVGNGEGAALMKNPELAGEIIRAVVDAVSVPVTVKIRTGWDKDDINAVKIAKIAEYNGASAVCVHGRTRAQMYQPPVDYETIAEVKKGVSIPVIGNGGIYNFSDAVKMFEKTGCDGIMIARGATGNPWIFKEIISGMEGNEFIKPDISERVDVVLSQIRRMIEYKGEYTGIVEARKHLSWYIQGENGASSVRRMLNTANSYEKIENILKEYTLKLKEDKSC